MAETLETRRESRSCTGRDEVIIGSTVIQGKGSLRFMECLHRGPGTMDLANVLRAITTTNPVRRVSLRDVTMSEGAGAARVDRARILQAVPVEEHEGCGLAFDPSVKETRSAPARSVCETQHARRQNEHWAIREVLAARLSRLIPLVVPHACLTPAPHRSNRLWSPVWMTKVRSVTGPNFSERRCTYSPSSFHSACTCWDEKRP